MSAPIISLSEIHAYRSGDDVAVSAEVVLFDGFVTLSVEVGTCTVRLYLSSAEVAEVVVDAINRAMRHPRKSLT